MEKITSFTIDHLKLLPGLYVSRKDHAGDSVITTFDIRMTRPNHEPVMNTAEIHTIEHLGATFLRNHKVYKDREVQLVKSDQKVHKEFEVQKEIKEIKAREVTVV